MPQFPFPRILDFVGRLDPFQSLEGKELGDVVQAMKVAFFPKGTAIMRTGGDPATHLYLVNSGLVRISLSDEDGQEVLVDFRSEGEFFGSVSLLQGRQALFNIFAEEDLIAFLLPGEIFKDLVDKRQEFKRHFAFALARNFKGMASLSGGVRGHGSSSETSPLDSSLIGRNVADLMESRLLSCEPQTPLCEAARLMTSHRVSSIVVQDEQETFAGIVTDTDIRSRAVAQCLDFQLPISHIMSSDLLTITPENSAYDALLMMTRHDVSHLLVSERGRPKGIISMHDLQRAMGSTPLGIVADIDKSGDVDHLVSLHREVMVLQESLMHKGGPVKILVGLVAEINERFLRRLIDLALMGMEQQGRGGPPCPYCWLALGSGGRKEQTLTTDQDNALAFDVPSSGSETKVKNWFLDFAEMVVDGLARCGFSRDLGGMMASQPDWCHSKTEWSTKTLWWINHPYDRTLLKASMFFDFRGVGDDTDFAGHLRGLVNQAAKNKQNLFLRYLAKNSLYNAPPLGFLRQFVVGKSGERKNKLDLKNKGMLPVVEFARILGLELNLTTTNTFERLELIGESGLVDTGLLGDITEAYGFMMVLRIKNYIQARAQGREPDNFLNPDGLGSLNRKLLKESFQVVGRAQDMLRRHYLTDHLKDV